jgi:hypothetical protein
MADFGICAAPGCDKPARQNRYKACSAHDARMRRGGTFDRRVERLTISALLGGLEAFGMWSVIGEGEPYQRPHDGEGKHPDGQQRTARCRCQCGQVRDIPIHNLTREHTSHCGCQMPLLVSVLRSEHGMTGTPEYRTWAHMKERCSNPKCGDWHLYGGRGIRVCREWQESFDAFYDHIGPRPAGTSIDRIDVNGHYEPGNVRWADKWTQARNKRPRVGLKRTERTAA